MRFAIRVFNHAAYTLSIYSISVSGLFVHSRHMCLIYSWNIDSSIGKYKALLALCESMDIFCPRRGGKQLLYASQIFLIPFHCANDTSRIAAFSCRVSAFLRKFKHQILFSCFTLLLPQFAWLFLFLCFERCALKCCRRMLGFDSVESLLEEVYVYTKITFMICCFVWFCDIIH